MSSKCEKIFKEQSYDFKYVTNSKLDLRNKYDFLNYSIKVLFKSENEFWVPLSDGKKLSVGYVLIDKSNNKQYRIKECGMEPVYIRSDDDTNHPFACRKLVVELVA